MFDEISLLCQNFNQKFTVYADDITISGSSANASHYNVMTKVLERYGYKVKESKTKRYTANQTPIVTGIALNNKLDVKNNFYKELRRLCEDISYHINFEPYAKLKDEDSSLKGKAHYLKQLNRNIPSFVLETQALLDKKLKGQL